MNKDTIYRQDAIDAITCDIVVTGRENAEVVAETISEFIERLEALPSAETGVIYCKDCKYRDPEDKRCDHGLVWCIFPKKDDDFCSYAKRRADE